jgi:outer membrane protein assembly factor BamB
VSCYDLGSGTLLWHHVEKTRFVEWQGGDGPRSTPTLHDNRVYAIGGNGHLSCLDLESGKLHWRQDVLKLNSQPNLEWAISGTPLIHGETVIVTGGDLPGPTLLAFSLKDGSKLWQSGEAAASYASPTLVTLCGQNVLLYSSAAGIELYDPGTGKQLFQQVWGNNKFPKGSQPVVLPEDRVFISAGYAMGCTLFQFIRNPAGEWSTEELWHHNKMKTQFASVMHVGNRLYGLDDGRIACLDATSGERLWKEGRYGAGVSLVLTTGKEEPLALIQSEPGTVYLVDISGDLPKELSQIPALSEKTWNYPALAGRYLLCRNDREAVCYELPHGSR